LHHLPGMPHPSPLLGGGGKGEGEGAAAGKIACLGRGEKGRGGEKRGRGAPAGIATSPSPLQMPDVGAPALPPVYSPARCCSTLAWPSASSPPCPSHPFTLALATFSSSWSGGSLSLALATFPFPSSSLHEGSNRSITPSMGLDPEASSLEASARSSLYKMLASSAWFHFPHRMPHSALYIRCWRALHGFISPIVCRILHYI
jgi:hypothetical protein